MSFRTSLSLFKWRITPHLLKATAILTVLFLFTMLPPITRLWQDSHRVISLSPEDTGFESSIPLTSGCRTEQLLYLQGALTSLELYIYIPESQIAPTNASVILTQNDISQSTTLTIYPEDSSGYYSVPFDFRKFVTGTAVLSIESQSDSHDATQVSRLYVSNQVGSGLPNMLWNGTECTSPLAFQYTITHLPSWFVYSFCMLALLFIAISLTTYILVIKPVLLDKYRFLLFLMSFSIILFTISARQPIASFLGEPKSEAAYDFWYSQISKGTLKSLFTLEAGLYLSWLQRLVMTFVVKIFPVKYIFSATQVVSLCIIGVFCSLFCLENTNKYLGKTMSLLISVFLGCSTLFANGYMFHSLGYWGILFIIWLFLSNLDSMKPVFYWGSMLMLVVLCFSKLFVVAWVPVGCFVLLILWKESSLRRKLFYILLSVLPIIHVTYIFLKTFNTIEQRQGVGSFQIPKLNILIENVFYYEIQAINRLILHVQNPNPLVANVFIGILFLCILGISVYFILSKNKESRYWGTFIFCCLLLSVSAVGVCILGGLGAFDMSAPVQWNTNIFGENVHWIYIYIPLVFLIFFFIYWCKERIKLDNNRDLKYTAALLLCCTVAPITLWYTAAPEISTPPSEYPVEWSKISYATTKESYYFPVNINIPGAELISLQHNSMGKLFGFDAAKDWKELINGIDADQTIPYSRASIASVEHESIVSITVSRINTNFDCNYTVQLFDKNGSLIEAIPQATSNDRQWMTFIPDEPVTGVSEVGFVYSESGTPAYVRGIISVGFVAIGVHS